MVLLPLPDSPTRPTISPLKTLKEYDAFNITLGLPFFRISPDHGPNIVMLNKNKSNPTSLIKTIKFLDEK